jgi:thioesterase domain-containing protein
MKSATARISLADGVPNAPDIPPELRAVDAAAQRAFTQYQPRSHDGRLTYFQSMTRNFDSILDYAPEWRHKVAGGVESVAIPGNHFTMLDGHLLAEQLRRRIDQAILGSRD